MGFKKEKMAKTTNGNTVSPASFNQLIEDTQVIGNITTKGNIRIDGYLKGELRAEGKVVIGASGRIEGEITCQNADILGIVIGKVKVSELMSLKATAKVQGEITTGKLAVEPNAVFTGNCNMGGGPQLNEQKEAKKPAGKEAEKPAK
jgi:cytoskeletal protein CcmA (bactofilin family)